MLEKEVKVINEIRMVYDATMSGFNDSLWTHWFSLPAIESELRAIKSCTCMCDCDVGEFFLNFMLHPEIRSHA